MGLDSDDPLAVGEVGKVGVAIDTIDDMRLLAGIPLDQVSTSMTINSTAAILLLLYQLVAEEQGVDPDQLRGRSKTTFSRSMWPEAHTSIRPGPRCARHRCVRLRRRGAAAMEPDLDQRLSHS